jgi:endonuclease/exonuclease/phosphatase family metal-dependent hydrolase
VVHDPAAVRPVGDRLRVASYNLEHFTDGLDDGPERTAELVQNQAAGAARLVDRIAPHVLVVQEIENSNSVRALNSKLAQPFPIAFITDLGTDSGEEGKLNLAVLARVPLLGPREIDFGPLTGPGRPTRGLLRFALDLGGDRRLLVYVMHLKSNFGHKARNIAQREAALRLLRGDAEALARNQSQYQWEMIALGDTNVDPELPEFARDTSFRPLKGWVDVWRGQPMPGRATIPTRLGDPEKVFPPATFDRIFVSPAMTNTPWVARDPGVIQEGCDTNDCFAAPGSKGHISDHFPVYIDLVR